MNSSHTERDQHKTLGELCEFIADCEHKTAPTEETGIPSIRTPNIGRGRLLLDGVNRVSEETWRLWTRRAEPRAGDLIIAREAPVGNVAIVPPNTQLCLGQRTVLARPDRTHAHPDYLCYLLNSPGIQSLIAGLVNGATVSHLNLREIRSLRIPTLPSVTDQRQRVSTIVAIDDLIDNTLRRIRLLQDTTRTIWSKFENDTPFEHKPISAAIDVGGGTTPSRANAQYWSDASADIDWYTPSDLTRSKSVFATSSAERLSRTTIEECGLRVYPKGSVMMTSRATIGVTAISTQSVCTNQGFIVCIPNERLPTYVLYNWILSTVDEFQQLATGATFKELSRGAFRSMKIPVPPLAAATAFQRTVEPYYDLLLNLQKRNATLRALRDHLLPRLLSGELDVSRLPLPPDDPIDLAPPPPPPTPPRRGRRPKEPT